MNALTDRLTADRRSWLMSRVRSKNTTAELRVRRVAHACGLRYRLHRRDLPGTPDMLFPRRRIALFVHGCFWRRHPGCPKSSSPKSRVEYWKEKFDRNVRHDQQSAARLESLGWSVYVIWECETKNQVLLSCRLSEIFRIAISDCTQIF